MTEKCQQAASSVTHQDVWRGKKWEKEFLVLIRTGLFGVPRYLKVHILKTTDVEKRQIESINI